MTSKLAKQERECGARPMNLRTKEDLESAGYITRTRQNTHGDHVLEAKVFIAFPGFSTIPYTIPVSETMPVGYQVRWLEVGKNGIEHIESDEMYRQVKAEAEE